MYAVVSRDISACVVTYVFM